MELWIILDLHNRHLRQNITKYCKSTIFHLLNIFSNLSSSETAWNLLTSWRSLYLSTFTCSKAQEKNSGWLAFRCVCYPCPRRLTMAIFLVCLPYREWQLPISIATEDNSRDIFTTTLQVIVKSSIQSVTLNTSPGSLLCVFNNLDDWIPIALWNNYTAALSKQITLGQSGSTFGKIQFLCLKVPGEKAICKIYCLGPPPGRQDVLTWSSMFFSDTDRNVFCLQILQCDNVDRGVPLSTG